MLVLCDVDKQERDEITSLQIYRMVCDVHSYDVGKQISSAAGLLSVFFFSVM